ncbi:MAG TPA: exodeoxyribonuclease VII large subunit [Pseudomonadales bacterium]|nr:exodeoxyribonuclease VII large subunit [Pseudomonadales bacterium]
MTDSLPLDQPPRGAAPRRILTPSQLNAEAQVVLEENFGLVWIEGELSNLARPGSGHWYFTLKDRRAQVRCAMFRGRNIRVKFTPTDGMQVLVKARVSLYVGRGEFQLIVDAIEPAGEGALRLAFEQLRARLGEEGLFDDARKRPLPDTPRHIGVITSPTGAAVRDILSVLARRWPSARVTLIPSAVQGDAATAELVRAFERLARWHGEDPHAAPELIIAGRGGGSLEDLWCFNEEAVARAIAACPVPVVSAVGHETDYTIADFVADLRAPTPSAAAELVTPDAGEWRQSFASMARELEAAARRRIEGSGLRLAQTRRRLRHPGVLLMERTQRVDELGMRLARRAGERIERSEERLTALSRRLAAASPAARLARDRRTLDQLGARLVRAEARMADARRSRLTRTQQALGAFNPLAVVDRGYALLTRPAAGDARFGEVIRDPAVVTAGETLHAHLARGVLEVRAVGVFAAPDGDDPADP